MVVVYMRHGDRTVGGLPQCWAGDDVVWNCQLTYLSMPNNNQSQFTVETPRLFRRTFMEGRNEFKGNCMTGQLTSQGYEQHVGNGEMLRANYIESTSFLPDSFEASSFHLRADNSDRTIQSAQALITGLYPPQMNASGLTEIIDIHTADETYDDINPSSILCPGLSYLAADQLASDLYKKFNSTVLAPLAADIGMALNVSNFTTGDLDHMIDCLHVHQCHNYSLPIDEQLVNAAFEAKNWMGSFLNNYPNHTIAGKYQSGLVISEIHGHLMSVVNATWTDKKRQQPSPGQSFYPSTSSTPKNAVDSSATPPLFFLYSAHDTSVMPYMSALGANTGTWCPYAGISVLELWQYNSTSGASEDDFAVRLIFQDEEITMRGCDYEGSLCPFSSFSENVAGPVMTTREECGYYDDLSAKPHLRPAPDHVVNKLLKGQFP
eukprot:TRINITY_DN1518_c0_g1_i5.p1 TRINITY_DN1518_c0_g1~~TRINITY_DN1518_c0_g1_i5.p1  ORF type:complete len:434 (+),score=83.09 TRINITY_DN1518_c0_g1_i5:329-1630(+)